MSKVFEIGAIGSAIVNSAVAVKMKEKIKMDKNLIDKWEKEDTEIASSIVRELAQYLFPTPKVEVLNKDTAGDQCFKVDVIMKFPEWVEPAKPEENLPEVTHPAYTCAFQVKTHKEQAEIFIGEYGEKGVKYKGQTYPCPGVFYCNAKTLEEAITLDNVRELGNFVGAIVHPEIYRAIRLLKELRDIADKEGPYTFLPERRFGKLFEPWLWAAMIRFKVIRKGGGRILYTW